MTNYPTSLLFPLLLVFYEIATYLSNDMYLPALPTMMQELGLSTQQAQLTLTIWFLGQASMPLIIGIISDRVGRRPVLLLGGCIYILATLLCANVHNFYLLLVGRFLEGSMVASMLVPGYACIHEMYEQNKAVKILALMGSISVLAPALGPLLGGIILLVTDWRGIFWVIAAWATIAILFLYQWMPETHPREKCVPIRLTTLFKSYAAILLNLQFMSKMVILGLIFAGWIAWISAGPLLVIKSFHFSEIAFGIIQVCIFAAFIFGNRLVKYLLDWLGLTSLINWGLGITLCGGILLLLLAVWFPQTLYPFLIAMLIYSFGSALCFAPLNRSIIESSDQPMGMRVALFAVFLTSFAVIGSALAGQFFNGTLLSLAYIIATAIVLAAFLRLINPLGFKPKMS